MKDLKRLIAYVILMLSVVAYSAVCLHSIDEIHYLKSFFPKTFTVEEALYAAAVELIKIIILGIPFLFLALVILIILLDTKKESSS